MWPFKKKKKEDAQEDAADDDEEDEEQKKIPEDAGLVTKVEMIQAELTKINGNIESFKEMRKSSTERFSTINEQIGELRGQMNDTQRSVGMIEVKATKAADLVESVHPDKLMIQVQKEDGKIEGLRGILEAKEEMMKNIMDQMKKMRDQMNLFRGVEQVIKLNEEVKTELMNIKRVSATVERHADRVENVFLESQKSFQAFNTFADKLESLKADIKELGTKVDKTEVGIGAALKKKEFEDRIEKIEKSDKKAKKVLKEVEDYYHSLDEKFKELRGKLRGEFEFKIEKAEIMSKAFEDLLKDNPMFAKGLKLQEYLNKHLGEGAEPAAASAEAKPADKKEEKKEGGEEKKEEKKEENKDDKEKDKK